MVRDIKPHLEYVANRNAVVQNNGAKHGFVVPGNADIHVRTDIYGACREPEPLENPWLHTLYIKVGLHPVHEPEPKRFGGGKQRETRPRPMNTGVLVPCMAVLPLHWPVWWERHYAKLALCFAAITIGYYVFVLPPEALETVHHTAQDYAGFITLIGSLYIVAGGIHLRVSGVGGPARNALFLALGGLASNLLGTTGASIRIKMSSGSPSSPSVDGMKPKS